MVSTKFTISEQTKTIIWDTIQKFSKNASLLSATVNVYKYKKCKIPKIVDSL